MTDNCKMVFEVENLNNASPATVSRCGIVYISATDLGWEPLVNTWIKDRIEFKEQCNPDEGAWMNELITKYIKGPEMFKMLVIDYTYMMEAAEMIRIYQLLMLLQACLQQWLAKNIQIDKATFEKYFVYCLSWAVAGLFETDEREKFHKWLEARNAPLPPIQQKTISAEKETVFDYFLEEAEETRQWKQWEPEVWTPPKKI
jgi:dynein heavy chain